MKVQCVECNVVSDLTEWKEGTFFCYECNDEHDGVECPTQGCCSIDGPGCAGYREVGP